MRVDVRQPLSQLPQQHGRHVAVQRQRVRLHQVEQIPRQALGDDVERLGAVQAVEEAHRVAVRGQRAQGPQLALDAQHGLDGREAVLGG